MLEAANLIRQTTGLDHSGHHPGLLKNLADRAGFVVISRRRGMLSRVVARLMLGGGAAGQIVPV